MSGKKKVGGVFIGGSSILIVLILLCLTTFAVLSMVSANADARMTARAVQASTDFYAADSAAERKLAEVDQALRALANDCASLPEGLRESAYLDRALGLDLDGVSADRTEGVPLLRYSVPLNERQTLSVVLEAVYPSKAGERFLRREWRVLYTADWESNEGLDVWDGGIGEVDLSAESGGAVPGRLPAGIGG